MLVKLVKGDRSHVFIVLHKNSIFVQYNISIADFLLHFRSGVLCKQNESRQNNNFGIRRWKS